MIIETLYFLTGFWTLGMINELRGSKQRSNN